MMLGSTTIWVAAVVVMMKSVADLNLVANSGIIWAVDWVQNKIVDVCN